MPLETTITGKILTVLFDDELTIYTANDFRDVVAAQLSNITHVVVNLSKVTDIDTSGLQLLIAIKNLAPEYEIEFVEHSAALTEAFELCGLSGQFNDPIVILRESSI